MPERRVMEQTRLRVDEIAAAMEAYRERLDHRYSRVLIAVLVIALISIGSVIFGFAILRHTNSQAKQNTTALCALRRDLEERVASSTRFIQEHPKGIPGIPIKTIIQGMEGQKRTIKALSAIKCPAPSDA